MGACIPCCEMGARFLGGLDGKEQMKFLMENKIDYTVWQIRLEINIREYIQYLNNIIYAKILSLRGFNYL